MSTHDGTNLWEPLPPTPEPKVLTDAEKLLAVFLDRLEEAQIFTRTSMSEYRQYSDMWKYWAARNEEVNAIHDYFAGITAESLLSMYTEE